MSANFAELSENEMKTLVDAIPYITVLIAGADGQIDKDELEWAEKVTEIRKFDYSSTLNSYYEAVGKNYQDRVNELIDELPGDTERRTEAIEVILGNLNPILAKLDPGIANECIDSFRSFAKHVAKASGGLFGFGSVSEDEARVMDLDMLIQVKNKL